MKKYLIIDTATTASSICLLLGEDRLIQKPLPQMNQTKEIIPLIKTLLEDHDLSLVDLTGIAICTGPGLFTGTRVGVMTAKTLSYAADIPLFPFSSFDIFENKAPYAALDAKCGRAHLFHKGKIRLTSHDELESLTEPIHVLEKTPFKTPPRDLVLNKKNYFKLSSLLDRAISTPIKEIFITYPS